MAMSLHAVPSELQLFQKAQSLGLVQREATSLTAQEIQLKQSSSIKDDDSTSKYSEKTINKPHLKLPRIKHPYRDHQPAIITRSLHPELSGFELFSFSTFPPKTSTTPDDDELGRKYHTEYGLNKLISDVDRSKSQAVELLRLPIMRSKTNMEYLSKKQKENTKVHMKKHKKSKKSKKRDSTKEFILPKELVPRNGGKTQIESQRMEESIEKTTTTMEKSEASSKVGAKSQKKPKYEFLYRPVDYYMRKYPILGGERRKKHREVLKAMGENENWHFKGDGGDQLTRSKTDMFPVESSIEHLKGRYATIKNVSDWIGGLQCKQKKLHNRDFVLPNTS